jgi:FeS assembly protein IscX
MKWVDVQVIAETLFDQKPSLNPMTLRFTDLRDKVMALDGFEDTVEHCNERVLEAIQMAWLEEFQDED